VGNVGSHEVGFVLHREFRICVKSLTIVDPEAELSLGKQPASKREDDDERNWEEKKCP